MQPPQSARVLQLVGIVLVCVHIVLFLSVLRIGASLHKPDAQSSWTVRVYHDVAQTAGPGADLFALYHAGVNAMRGLSVYDTNEDPAVTPYFYPYRYLPIAAQTLGRALATLTPRSAYVLWALLTELTLVLVIVAFRRSISNRWSSAWGTAILLLSTPYWLELYIGQFTMVAAGLTCLAVLGWATRVHRRPGAPGVLLVAAALLKVFPLVTLPAFLRTRGGGSLAAATVAIVTSSNLPLFFTDPASIDAFWSKNFLGEPVGLDAGNHSFLYVVFLAGQLLGGEWNLPLWGALTIVWRAAVLGGTAFIILRARNLNVEIGASTLLLAHFVSYFQVWEHHISAAVVAGVLLCVGLERAGSARDAGIALAATAALALPTPFAWLPSDPSAWSSLERLLPPLAKTIPLLVLFGAGMSGVTRTPAWTAEAPLAGPAPTRAGGSGTK